MLIASVLYKGPSSKTLGTMQRTQNVVPTVLPSTSQTECITPLIQELHWLLIVVHAKVKVLVISFQRYLQAGTK